MSSSSNSNNITETYLKTYNPEWNNYDLFVEYCKGEQRQIRNELVNNEYDMENQNRLISVYDADINYDVDINLFKTANRIGLDKNNILFKHEENKEQYAICTKERFEKNFDEITNDMFVRINWNNVLIAGGSILKMLTSQKNEDLINSNDYNDIDIFIYGLQGRDLMAKLFELEESIRSVIPKEYNMISIRMPRVIMFVSQHPYRHIQIILRVFRNINEILNTFDVDCCAVGYDGTNVFCTPRSHYAIVNHINVVNMAYASASYEFRLTKYGLRGYSCYVPNFDNSKVNTEIYLQNASNLRGLARLLSLEKLDTPEKYELYSDILDRHRASMRRNINNGLRNRKLKTVYEQSDYTSVYLPWGNGITSKTIIQHMKKKHDKLNEKLKRNRQNTRYYCSIGELASIITNDKSIVLPRFNDDEEEDYYIRTFIYGKLHWSSARDPLFCKNGLLNTIVSTDDVDDKSKSWYESAYIQNTDKTELFTYVKELNYDKLKAILTKPIDTNSYEESEKIRYDAVNVRDITSKSLLQTAIYTGEISIINLLLDHNANPTYVSKLGETAIHTACIYSTYEILSLLLEYCNDKKEILNKRDSFGLTPILYALIYGNYSAFKKLYTSKLILDESLVWDFKLDKTKSYTLLQMCSMYRRHKFAQFIFRQKRIIDTEFDIITFCVQNMDYEMIQLILNNITKVKFNIVKEKIISKCEYILNGIQYNTSLHEDICKLFNTVSEMFNDGEILDKLVIRASKDGNVDMFNTILEYDSKIISSRTSLIMLELNEIQNAEDNSDVIINYTYDYKINIDTISSTNIVVPPKWLIEMEVASTLESNKNSVSKSSKDDAVKKIEGHNGILNIVRQFTTGKNSELSVDADDVESIETSKKVKNIKLTCDVPVKITGINLSEMVKYMNLFDLIRQNDTLEGINFDDYNLKCCLSKSRKTLLDIAVIYNNYEALEKMVSYMIDKNNEKIKVKCNMNNMKLDEVQSVENKVSYDIRWASLIITALVANNDIHQILGLIGKYDNNFYKYYNNCGIILNGIVQYYSGKPDKLYPVLELLSHFTFETNGIVISKLLSNNTVHKITYELLEFLENYNSTTLKSSENPFSTEIFKKLCNYHVREYLQEPRQQEYINNAERAIEFLCNKDGKYINEFCFDKHFQNYKTETACMDMPLFELLLRCGLDIHKPLYNGEYSLIHIMIYNNKFDNVKHLCELFPDLINYETAQKKQTPLMIAIKYYRSQIISYLLENGADEDSLDIFGNTPLHYVALFSNNQVVIYDENEENEESEEIRTVPGMKYHNHENNFRMTPSDYIINNMKIYMHHVRNERITFDRMKMSCLINLFNNNFSHKLQGEVRVAIEEENVHSSINYILQNMPKTNESNIPEILLP